MGIFEHKDSGFPALPCSGAAQSLWSFGRKGLLLSAVALVMAATSLNAQEEHPAATTDNTSAATLSIQAKLVNVYVTVRDKKGGIVQGLGKDDFNIEEDGRLQKIGFFSKENNLPFTVGLLVDTSPSEYNMIDEEREASREFLDAILRPTDQAFVLHFDTEVELLQGLTSSLGKLEKSLDALRGVQEESQQQQPAGKRVQNDSSGNDDDRRESGRQSSMGGNSTHLFDAVYLAADEVLKQQSGRKAIVILGDGDDLGSRMTRYQAIRAAQDADLSIYCIRIADENFGKSKSGHKRFSMPVGLPFPGIPGAGGGQGGRIGGQTPGGGNHGGGGAGGGIDRKEGKKNLEELASKTGGSFFEVSKKQSLKEIYSKIQEELRSQYSLGYTPDAAAKDGFRRIKVKVRRENVTVQAREGYYADSE
jgi:VWFA-related protein